MDSTSKCIVPLDKGKSDPQESEKNTGRVTTRLSATEGVFF